MTVAPNYTLAARHVALLTGSEQTYCSFRLLRGEGEAQNWDASITARIGGIINFWHHIEEAQRDGWQVYIVVNEGGHDSRSITRVRALFVDADGTPMPAQWHAEPDFIIRRDDTHWHAYWLVRDLVKGKAKGDAASFRGTFRAAQKRLAAYYRTDPKVCDLPRVMRLAGSVHLKDPAHPYLITIEGDANARHPKNARTVAEIIDGLPEETAPEPRTTRSMPTGEPVSLEIVRDMLKTLDAGCDRDEWRNIIAAIRAAPVPDDEDESGRLSLAQEWSAGAHNYEGPDDVERVFDDMEPPEPGDDDKIHFGSLVAKARGAGYDGPKSIAEAERDARFEAICEEDAKRQPSPGAVNRAVESLRRRQPSPEFVERATATILARTARGAG